MSATQPKHPLITDGLTDARRRRDLLTGVCDGFARPTAALGVRLFKLKYLRCRLPEVLGSKTQIIWRT